MLGAGGGNNHYKYEVSFTGVCQCPRMHNVCVLCPGFYCLFLWIPGGPAQWTGGNILQYRIKWLWNKKLGVLNRFLIAEKLFKLLLEIQWSTFTNSKAVFCSKFSSIPNFLPNFRWKYSPWWHHDTWSPGATAQWPFSPNSGLWSVRGHKTKMLDKYFRCV